MDVVGRVSADPDYLLVVDCCTWVAVADDAVAVDIIDVVVAGSDADNVGSP